MSTIKPHKFVVYPSWWTKPFILFLISHADPIMADLVDAHPYGCTPWASQKAVERRRREGRSPLATNTSKWEDPRLSLFDSGRS